MRRFAWFWGSSALVAALFTVLPLWLLPYERLGLHTVADRQQAWLLTVFCAGVMAVLFGASGALGTLHFVGMRDVLEAGSVLEAMRQRVRARRERGPYTGNFGAWMVATGALLLAIYFALWLALPSA